MVRTAPKKAAWMPTKLLFCLMMGWSLWLLAGAPPASRPASKKKAKSPASPSAKKAKSPASQPAKKATWPKGILKPPAKVARFRAQALMYTGGLRSYFEPCGCQADMLGGFTRLATLYATYRRLGVDLLPVDAGNLYFENFTISKAKSTQNKLKALMIADLFRQMGVRAVGVGPHDLVFGLAMRKKLAARSKIQVVASNLIEQKTRRAPFATRAVLRWGTRKIGVFSLTASPPPSRDKKKAFPKHFWKQRGLALTPPVAAAKREIKALRAAKVDFVILLSTLGIARTTVLLSKVQGIDFAIDGHDEDGIDPPQDHGSSFLLSTPKEGQKAGAFFMYLRPKKASWAVLETPAGLRLKLKEMKAQIKSYHQQAKVMLKAGVKAIAQVYLKSAKALEKKIKAVKARLHLPPRMPPNKNAYIHALVPLSKHLSDDAAVLRRVARYQADAKKANLAALKKIKPIKKTKKGNWFVGVATCKTCHQSQYQFWKKTRHARAYATLAKKKKQFDLDCIGCHVVGWQKPGGLYDIQKPQRLANVQCENCHSHGGLHATKMPTKKTIQAKVTAATCTACHQGSHDPKFNFLAKLKKILGKGHGAKRLAELLKQKK